MQRMCSETHIMMTGEIGEGTKRDICDLKDQLLFLKSLFMADAYL